MTYFTLDNYSNRTVSGWRFGGKHSFLSPSWRGNAKRHAASNGAAGVWLGNGDLLLFFRDGDKVRQRTIPDARPR